MSTPTALQSKGIVFNIGTDGVTYKKAVCKKSFDWSIEPQITQEDTDCGPLIAVGTVKFSFNFELVLNTTPNSSTEVSANEIANYANNGTTVYIQTESTADSGASYYRQASGLLSNYKESAAVNGLLTATGTFIGNGT